MVTDGWECRPPGFLLFINNCRFMTNQSPFLYRADDYSCHWCSDPLIPWMAIVAYGSIGCLVVPCRCHPWFLLVVVGRTCQTTKYRLGSLLGCSIDNPQQNHCYQPHLHCDFSSSHCCCCCCCLLLLHSMTPIGTIRDKQHYVLMIAAPCPIQLPRFWWSPSDGSL